MPFAFAEPLAFAVHVGDFKAGGDSPCTDELFADRRARLDASRLRFAGRWLTPPFSPLRFDNRFFLLEWPAERRPHLGPDTRYKSPMGMPGGGFWGLGSFIWAGSFSNAAILPVTTSALPDLMASSKCKGRKPGGVARITRSMSVSSTRL